MWVLTCSLLLMVLLLTRGVQASVIPEVFVITMNESGFHPELLTLKQGDIVLFTNAGESDHWPASDIHPTHTIYPGSNINKCESTPHGFDACKGVLPGESWNFTFRIGGEWRCHDHLAPELRCTISVEEDSLTANENGKEDLRLELLPRLRAIITRVYYTLFPGKLNERLETLDPFVLTKNDTQLLYWLHILGPEKAMQWLLEHSGGGSLVDCHQPAHQIGRIAYALKGGKAFEKGDASCHSGYYHGAMERLLTEKGTLDLAATIEDTCKIFDTDFGRFECLHGVGHGVMAYHGYDLPEALTSCDKLNTTFAARSCYGGVFMENIITGLGIGAVPDHDTDWLSDDPYFPCNALDSRYELQHDCYQMQTSWMLKLYDYDFDRVAETCLGAPLQMKPICFRSYGRDAAGHTLRDPAAMTKLCSKVLDEENYREECIRGGVNVIIDFWGSALEGQAAEFCSIQLGDEKNSCYAILAARLPELFPGEEDLARACDHFESSFRQNCTTKA